MLDKEEIKVFSVQYLHGNLHCMHFTCVTSRGQQFHRGSMDIMLPNKNNSEERWAQQAVDALSSISVAICKKSITHEQPFRGNAMQVAVYQEKYCWACRLVKHLLSHFP